MGKSLYFAVIIVNPKLLREKGTEARFPISLPCTRLLLLLPVFPFHLVVDGFVYLEISSVLLQNKLKLTDSQTEVFCLNSRLYSGTSFFYRITVSSFSKKKNKKKNYTNPFNWLTGLMMILTTDVGVISTWQSFINVLVNISPCFIPGNPSIQSQSPEVDELGVGTAC